MPCRFPVPLSRAVPCRAMPCRGFPCRGFRAVARLSVPWRAVVFRAVPKRAVAFCAVPCHPVPCRVVPWFSVVFRGRGTAWHIARHHGTLLLLPLTTAAIPFGWKYTECDGICYASILIMMMMESCASSC
jgi:hypothetical protein